MSQQSRKDMLVSRCREGTVSLIKGKLALIIYKHGRSLDAVGSMSSVSIVLD